METNTDNLSLKEKLNYIGKIADLSKIALTYADNKKALRWLKKLVDFEGKSCEKQVLPLTDNGHFDMARLYKEQSGILRALLHVSKIEDYKKAEQDLERFYREREKEREIIEKSLHCETGAEYKGPLQKIAENFGNGVQKLSNYAAQGADILKKKMKGGGD